MIFGNPDVFAIECFHEPLPGMPRHWVAGRMCLRFGKDFLGDIDNPLCPAYEAGYAFEKFLARAGGDAPDDVFLNGLGDRECFDFLQDKLYPVDDSLLDRMTEEEIRADTERWGPYDFLTNRGESFDRFKSFVVPSAKAVRVLWKDGNDRLHFVTVEKAAFIDVLRQWLAWFGRESKG